MSNKEKKASKETKSETYDALKALYCTGKVKPTLNKILAQLEIDTESLELTLLACQCLVRTKNYGDLAIHADNLIKWAPENSDGYYYKGVALNHKKGKEQEALKNFNEALAKSPENIVYLKSKGSTHFLLYTDYNLPINFADKHRIKAEDSFTKIIDLIEQQEEPSYFDLLVGGEVRILLGQKMDAKRYFFKAVNTYNAADPANQDVNIYKDLIRAQKECEKLIQKSAD